MPRIRCHYDDCVFLDEGHCGAAAVEIEPEAGCLTYSRVDAATPTEDDWEEDELEDEFEDEEEEWDEDDDDWDEDDDDY